MTPPGRCHLAAHLSPSGRWRRAVYVVRAHGGARPAVLSFAPPAVLEDQARLGALAQDVEAAARVHHRNVVPVRGLESIGDGVAVAEDHVAGASLRALLDAGGPLAPAVAARIVADACAGLAALHAASGATGPLVHGALSCERLKIGAQGVTRVDGVALASGEGSVAGDVRALASALAECLAVPAHAEAPAGEAEVRSALAAVVERALAEAREGCPFGASALGAVLEPHAAPHEVVEARLEAVLPAARGERAAIARLVADALEAPPEPDAALAPVTSERQAPVAAGDPVHAAAPGARTRILDAVPGGGGGPERALEAPAPVAPARVRSAPAELAGSPDASQLPGGVPVHAPSAVPSLPPAPGAAAHAPRWPLVAGVSVALFALGFGVGLGLARGSRIAPGGAQPSVAASPAAPAVPARADAGAPAPAAVPVTPAPALAPVAAAEPPALPAGEKRADPRPPSRPPRAAAEAPREPSPGSTRSATPRARLPVGRGTLSVTAPAQAEIWVDGRRAGKGSVRIELDEGVHQVEARLGEARIAERFSLRPGETWTYEVTPSP